MPTPCCNASDPKNFLPKRAHLLGVAGSGMRGMARALLDSGWTLTGSDQNPLGADDLVRDGLGFQQENRSKDLPPNLELLIYSDAVRPDHPQLREAAQRGIASYSYFEMIARLMREKRGLAVAGTHGKSTTTAIATHLLTEAGADPTVFCGAWPVGQTAGGRGGAGPILLAEASEYRDHFLDLPVRQAVLTGVELDHFDYFHSLAQLEASFARFVQKIPKDGLLLARADDPICQRLARSARCRVETFAMVSAPGQKTPPHWRGNDSPDWIGRPLETGTVCRRWEIVRRGTPLVEVQLPLLGEHNRLNALAAAALAWHQDVEPGTIGRALSTVPGLARRQEWIGRWRGTVELYDDYAHHPTEVRATLSALRQAFPDRRICCVFQPHQVSRTAKLLNPFARELGRADRVWIADIYRAREGQPHPDDVTAADLAEAVRGYGVVVGREHRLAQIAESLIEQLKPNDILITVGAGDIRRIYDEYFEGFSQFRAAG